MARNCEKKLIGLNRMYIKKHQEEESAKNAKRPSLHTLHSVQEVKKWIPGIKKELDYCLQQLSGARQHQYPDGKIKEFEEKVVFLEREYKRFVNRVFELDPNTTGIPWQPRGYVSKRKASEMKDSGKHDGTHSKGDYSAKKKICTPLVDNETKQKTTISNQGKQDLKVGDKNNKLLEERLLNLDYGSSSDEDE